MRSEIFRAQRDFANEMIPPISVDGDEALRRLSEGNKRFVSGNTLRLNQSPARRIEVSDEQHPFAVVLSCSDSRVPPEIVFDQGLGDLYVVRIAGNVLDEVVLASIEYAVARLGIHLVVVLGHQNCGVVRAALEGNRTDAQLDALLQRLETPMRMAGRHPVGAVDNVVKTNIQFVVARLRLSKPLLANLVEQKGLKIVGAYYQLSTGIVNVLS